MDAGYPNCYFGFLGKNMSFNSSQVDTLKMISLEKILLETELPYLMLGNGIRVNIPPIQGEVADLVATLKVTPDSVVLSACINNSFDLFGL